MKSKILLFLVLLCASLACYAQSITLVETGIATTKDEATKQALRNALEQAYGTFVSSNTKIVNDQVTKDEIVSISQGNIEKYNEVSCQRVGNDYHVTVQTTVSIGKLISYAKGKGASTEFAGATFGMNMKIKKLNKKNELKAIAHLAEELFLFENNNNFFDYSLDQSSLEPKETSDGRASISFVVKCRKNKNYYAYYDMLRNGLATIGSRTKTEECTNLIKTATYRNYSYCDEHFAYDGFWYFRNDYRNEGSDIINQLYFLGLFNAYKFIISTGIDTIKNIGVSNYDRYNNKSLYIDGIKGFFLSPAHGRFIAGCHLPDCSKLQRVGFEDIEYSNRWGRGWNSPTYNVHVFSSRRFWTSSQWEKLVCNSNTDYFYKTNEPIVMRFTNDYNIDNISKITKIEVRPVKELDIYEFNNNTWVKKTTF